MKTHRASPGTPRERHLIIHCTVEESMALGAALLEGRAWLDASPDKDSSVLKPVGIELDGRKLFVRVKREVI